MIATEIDELGIAVEAGVFAAKAVTAAKKLLTMLPLVHTSQRKGMKEALDGVIGICEPLAASGDATKKALAAAEGIEPSEPLESVAHQRRNRFVEGSLSAKHLAKFSEIDAIVEDVCRDQAAAAEASGLERSRLLTRIRANQQSANRMLGNLKDELPSHGMPMQFGPLTEGRGHAAAEIVGLSENGRRWATRRDADDDKSVRRLQ